MHPDYQEIREILRELAISSKATEKQMQETDRRMQETDRRIQETDRQMQETNRKMQETDLRFKETEKFIKELGKKIGDLGDKFGYFTEGMALPTMEKILEEKFHLDTISPRFKKKLPNGHNLEYDVFGYCNGIYNNVVIVEIKSKLRKDDIYEMVGELSAFKSRFPEFADKHLYGILAAVYVPTKELIKNVLEAGLYFARIAEDVFTLTENAKALDFNAPTT